MSEFPSNRNRDKTKITKPNEEKKRVEQVTQGQVERRKKPLGKRLTETFVGGDAKSVWAFVALDVMVPAAKDMLADAVSQGVERMIFGEAQSTGRRTGRRPSGGPHISYNKYSGGARRLGPPDEKSRHELSRRARASHDFDEIILSTRVEAEEVIERMCDLVDKYEAATVADLYDLIGVSGTYTDDKWGWMDLRTASTRRVRNGYLLNLPAPDPLD